MSQIEAISLLEASKQALEALESAVDQLAKPYSTQAQYAITSLRVAIASYSQAIDAAEQHTESEPSRSDIKQSTECVGEPVAWMTETGSVWKTREKNTDIPLYTTPPQSEARGLSQQQRPSQSDIKQEQRSANEHLEPVGVIDSTISGHIDWLCTFFPKQGTKLYTHPQPAQPKREPLNHEQRFDLLTAFEPHKNKWESLAILIDMVETAHGITGETK